MEGNQLFCEQWKWRACFPLDPCPLRPLPHAPAPPAPHLSPTHGWEMPLASGQERAAGFEGALQRGLPRSTWCLSELPDHGLCWWWGRNTDRNNRGVWYYSDNIVKETGRRLVPSRQELYCVVFFAISSPAWFLNAVVANADWAEISFLCKCLALIYLFPSPTSNHPSNFPGW